MHLSIRKIKIKKAKKDINQKLICLSFLRTKCFVNFNNQIAQICVNLYIIVYMNDYHTNQRFYSIKTTGRWKTGFIRLQSSLQPTHLCFTTELPNGFPDSFFFRILLRIKIIEFYFVSFHLWLAYVMPSTIRRKMNLVLQELKTHRSVAIKKILYNLFNYKFLIAPLSNCAYLLFDSHLTSSSPSDQNWYLLAVNSANWKRTLSTICSKCPQHYIPVTMTQAERTWHPEQVEKTTTDQF